MHDNAGKYRKDDATGKTETVACDRIVWSGYLENALSRCDKSLSCVQAMLEGRTNVKSFFPSAQTDYRTHPASYGVGAEVCFSGGEETRA